MPSWLRDHKSGERVNISELLDSRIVYYPGAHTDGSPIRTFNSAHAAHVYVYVDYMFKRDEIEVELSDRAFFGYHLCHTQEVTQKELLPRQPQYHVTCDEMRIAEQRDSFSIKPEEGYAVLKIYERDMDKGDKHGAPRFAILYIGGDANATFDALFGNTHRTPFACVVCGNMGSEFSSFGRGSLLESIAERTNRFPKYLMAVPRDGWNGYERLSHVGKTGEGAMRSIWVRSDAE